MSKERKELSVESIERILKSRANNVISMSNVGTTLTRKIISMPDEIYITDNGNQYRKAYFNLITSHQKTVIDELCAEGEFTKACSIKMSYALWVENDFQPRKGDTVKCLFGTYENKDGITCIEISGVSALESKEATKVTFDLSGLGAAKPITEEEETLESVLGKKK